MAPPGDLDALSPTELKALVLELLGKVAALEQTVAAQRAEIARLKGLKGRPVLKPSGMEKASEPKPPSPPKGRRGPVTPRVAVEDQVHRGYGATGFTLQGLRGLPGPGPRPPGPLHPLSPGALADAGRAPDRGAVAGRRRYPFRAGPAPLCVG